VITSQDGTKIAFTKQGSGPPLIVVDGAFCFRENGPSPQLAALLAPHFTVFTYDRRGRGESGATAPNAIAREVEDLRALVEEAGGSAHLVGISSGAALSLHAAAEGVPAKKLALFEPPYLAAGARPRSFSEMKARLQELVSAGDRAGAVRFFMAEVFGAPRFFVALMPFLMRGAWRKNESVAHTLPSDLALLEDASVLSTRSAAIAVPTLVIGGEKSPRDLRDAVSRVAGALPNARELFLPGQTHNFAAAALAPVLVEYLLRDAALGQKPTKS